jgi:hypothetical protein
MTKLEETLKDQIKQAMRDKDRVRRDILKLALSEITSKSAMGEVTQEQAEKLVRKIVENNHESIAALAKRDSGDDREKLEQLKVENEILEELLPKEWSTQDVQTFIEKENLAEPIAAANNDGQAMGIAMKALKSAGAAAKGNVVNQVIRSLRG